ncbi:MAG: PocR ligand-binding domain-containing protein [Thermodesulfobacteriota bacterium]
MAGQTSSCVLAMTDPVPYRVSPDEANLLNQMREAVYLIDPDHNLLFLNQGAERLLGFPCAEALGRKCFELFGHGDHCRERCPIPRIIHSPTRGLTHQVGLRAKDGRELPLFFEAQPFVKEGEVVGTLAYVWEPTRDLPSDPLASQGQEPAAYVQQALSEAGLRDLFNVPDLERMVKLFAEIHGVTSAIFDDHMEMVTSVYNFSEACLMIRAREDGLARCLKSDERLLQAAQENRPSTLQCVSAGLMDAVAPIVIGGKRLGTWALGQVMIEGEYDEARFRSFAAEIGLDPDGFITALRTQTRMPMAKMEKLAEFLVLLTQMLGQVGLNHLVLNHLHEQLRREKELLAVTLRSIGDGIVTLDGQGRVLLLNAIAEKMTGWPSHEAIGRDVAEVVRLVHPRDRERRIALREIAELCYDQAQLTTLCPILVARSGREYAVIPTTSEIATPGRPRAARCWCCAT